MMHIFIHVHVHAHVHAQYTWKGHGPLLCGGGGGRELYVKFIIIRNVKLKQNILFISK